MPTHAALTVLIAIVVVPVLIVGLWYVIRTRLRRHPEPIASWARNAMSSLDHGNLRIDDDPAVCRQALARDWNITDEASLRGQLVGLLHRRPVHAWSGIRAIRVALLGAGAGYVNEEWAWDLVRAAAVGLQEHYVSFEEMVGDYLESRRAWRSLPRDQQVEHDALDNLIAAQRDYPVSFRANVASTTPAVLPPEAARHYR